MHISVGVARYIGDAERQGRGTGGYNNTVCLRGGWGRVRTGQKGKGSEGKAGTYLFSPAPVLDKHVCFCLIANSEPVLISASRVNKCRSGMGGQGSVPCLPACAYMPTISPSLASTRQTRHADGTAAWSQQGLSCRYLVYAYSGSVNQWAGWWVDAVQWRIWSAECVGSDVRWATNGQRGGAVSASEEAKEGSVTVCVLLLWLGSRTVSHVAWALAEHCRLQPTCAEHGDWRAAWCGTRRIRHYTATGKFTRQAGSTKSQAVAARKQEKQQLSTRRLHFAGATNFAFRTALVTGSERQKRSMLEPRWRPVQVKVLTSVPSAARANQISHSFTFQSREQTDGRTDLWSSFRTFRGLERAGGRGRGARD